MTRLCTVPGCDAVHKARDLCRRHYGMAQWRGWLGAPDLVDRLAALEEGADDPPAIDVSGLGETAPGEGAWVDDKTYWDAPTTGPRDEVRTGLGVLRQMCGALSRGCDAIEFKIVEHVIDRLTIGLDDYGVWPRKDGRDMAKEGGQESIDWIIYAAKLWMEQNP